MLSLLEFACGATVTFGASWDVFRHSNHPIELHGTEGSLRLPDPDTFGGVVALSDRGGAWEETDTSTLPYGAVELADGCAGPGQLPDAGPRRPCPRAAPKAAPPRASGELALHVLEVMEAILRAGETGTAQAVPGSVQQPRELREDEASSLLA